VEEIVALSKAAYEAIQALPVNYKSYG